MNDALCVCEQKVEDHDHDLDDVKEALWARGHDDERSEDSSYVYGGAAGSDGDDEP